jgi:ATP/maltotriose-dependent transcriptional regulator MalT
LAVGSPAWFAWLAAPTTRSFAFHGAVSTFTARKEERQRGSAYWSAYRSIAGRVRKTYLGTATALTQERLETAAATLSAATTASATVPAPTAPQGVPTGPLLQTKLFIPRPRPQLVSRERLAEQLTVSLRHKLVVITGPAGAGKTTLMTAWYDDQTTPRTPLVWLTLDESDNDPVRFWRYLCAALEGVAPGVSVTILELLGATRQFGSDALVIALSNLLLALPHELILVLDDYHLITEPGLHQTLGLLIERGPPQLHLVLIGRAEPPLPLARLRARGDLAEIRANDLRFTASEVGTLINERLNLDLADDLVATLAERTEGWAVGLHLAALALRNQPPPARAAFVITFGGSHRYIGDYLLEEVLHGQSTAIQEFLLQTALLGRLCGPLCDAIVQPAAAAPGASSGILEQLERAGLFLVPLDEERTWYRYHRLFAELLRKRLHQQQPELVPELYRRASDWFAAADLFDEAIEYALAARDMTFAASLIERAAHATTIRNEHQTILRWLTQLPLWTIFRAEASIAQARGDRAGALAALQRASALAERIAQPFALLLTSLSRLRHHLIAHDLPQLAHEHAVLLGLLATFGFSDGQEYPPPRFPDYIWELHELALAWVALVQADQREALRRADYIAAYSENVGHLGCLIPALALRSLAQVAGGDEQAALTTLARALTLAEPEGYLRTFIEFGAPLRALLHKLVMQAHKPGSAVIGRQVSEYAQRLHAAFTRTKETPAQQRGAAQLPEPLSAREREILIMLADGLGNRDIAAHLFIASGTVKWHVNRIFGKLAVTSRTAAVARARALGLLA